MLEEEREDHDDVDDDVDDPDGDDNDEYDEDDDEVEEDKEPKTIEDLRVRSFHLGDKRTMKRLLKEQGMLQGKSGKSGKKW